MMNPFAHARDVHAPARQEFAQSARVISGRLDIRSRRLSRARSLAVGSRHRTPRLRVISQRYERTQRNVSTDTAAATAAETNNMFSPGVVPKADSLTAAVIPAAAACTLCSSG